MKKNFLILSICLATFCNCSLAQTSDTTLTYLSSLDLSVYQNRPVDSFLTKIPNTYTSTKIFSVGNPKYADVLSVSYPNKIFAWVYVYDFIYMNPRSETFSWDISLFKKEKVDHIEIWKDVDCYNGCPDGTPTQ